MRRFEDRLKLLAPAPASDAIRARLALPAPRRRLWTRTVPMAAAAAGLIAAIAFATLKAPPSLPSAPNDAEKEFRRIERMILGAKSLRVSFKRIAELPVKKGGFEKIETTGVLLLKQGSRLNLTSTNTNAPGQPQAFTTTSFYLCNGKNSSHLMKTPQGIKSVKTSAIDPKNLNEKAQTALARQSIAVPTWYLTVDLGDLKGSLELSGFAFETDEKGQRILTYRVGVFDAKLWVDPQTGLPIKRAYSNKEAGTFVETYESCELDPNLGDELFQIPADK